MLSRTVARLPRACTCPTKCNPLIHRPPIQQVLTLTTLPLTPHLLKSTYATTSSSSARWKTRQTSDPYTRASKLSGLKSRAAFKLLEIDAKHHLFTPGATVVDLGYAPGSWSQVAISKTQPGGRVVGIDVIPAQPPRGVSTLQGDFLSEGIREEVRKFVVDEGRGRGRGRSGGMSGDGEGLTVEELEEEGRGVIERAEGEPGERGEQAGRLSGQKALDRAEGRVVNVVLSDMSEPWPQTASMWIKSVSNPYRRMMNTSGMPFRDHAGSMVRGLPLSTYSRVYVC